MALQAGIEAIGIKGAAAASSSSSSSSHRSSWNHAEILHGIHEPIDSIAAAAALEPVDDHPAPDHDHDGEGAIARSAMTLMVQQLASPDRDRKIRSSSAPRLWPLPSRFSSGGGDDRSAAANRSIPDHDHDHDPDHDHDHHHAQVQVSPRLQFFYALGGSDCVASADSSSSSSSSSSSAAAADDDDDADDDDADGDDRRHSHDHRRSGRSAILDEAFVRYRKLIFGNHRLITSRRHGGANSTAAPIISTLCIALKSMDETVSDQLLLLQIQII
jgi:hypothetical protein